MTERQLVSVRTAKALKIQLVRIAREQKKSINQLVTEMIERQLERENGGPLTNDPFDMTDATPENWEGFSCYKKRPVEILACQINLPEGFKVYTLDGVRTGQPGDYLVIGVEGEKYPVKKSVFEATYDLMVEAP